MMLLWKLGGKNHSCNRTPLPPLIKTESDFAISKPISHAIFSCLEVQPLVLFPINQNLACLSHI